MCDALLFRRLKSLEEKFGRCVCLRMMMMMMMMVVVVLFLMVMADVISMMIVNQYLYTS